MGITEKGIVTAVYIYFPVKNSLYYLQVQIPYEAQYNKEGLLVEQEQIRAPKRVSSKSVYCNNRVSERVVKRLLKKGYSVINDIDGTVLWPEALLGVISGKFAAAFFHTPMVRD